MNVTLGSGKAVHHGHQFEDFAPTSECGGNKAAERYYVTTDEVTCRKCIKWAERKAERLAKAAAEVTEVEAPVEVIETPAAEVVTEVEAIVTEVPAETVTVVEIDMVESTKGIVAVAGAGVVGLVLNTGRRGGEPGWSAEDEDWIEVADGKRNAGLAATALLRHLGYTGEFRIKINRE